MTTERSTTARAARALRDELAGRVILPGEAGYESARQVFHGGIDRRPAAIAQVANAADVARVVRSAADTGAELAVRSGGHSGAGHGTTEGGIVLDLSPMKALDIDPRTRTAWAQTGLTAGEYTAATGVHGLATGFGDTGSVGIGGITLGGGIGFLVRKHGLTIDSLLAAEVVTADGRLLHVDDEHHPDLFWALRGGGGNFGVVTRLRFRLHDVEGFVGGILVLPATTDVIASFVEAADEAPEELSTIANVMTAPPLPFLPDSLHGELVLMAFLAHAGEVEAGRRAVQPFRDLAEPLADLVRPMPYAEMFPPGEEEYRPVAVGRTMFLDRIDRGGADLILERLRASTAPMSVAHLRVLGGAMARVADDATAFAHRRRRMMAVVAAVYEEPEDEALHLAWVADTAEALRADAPLGTYVGFLGDDGPARIREAYPGTTWDRLVAAKRRYDPGNVFRLNHNVVPDAVPV